MTGKRKDITGQRFGMLVALEFVGNQDGKYPAYLCQCDCGKQKTVLGQSLRNAGTDSCGCNTKRKLSESLTKHGHAHTKIYKVWAAMKDRCNNPNNTHFAEYGGRGIAVCERWTESFANFLADMGERPEGMTIDRIDNAGNYEPSNCRWATRTRQQRNRRVNRLLTVNGETKCVSDWAAITGVPRGRIASRLDRGWTEEAAVMTPLLNQGRKDLQKKVGA